MSALTPERLEALDKAREKAKLPATLEAKTDPMGLIGVVELYESHVPGVTMGPDLPEEQARAEYVALALNESPALVAEVRRLQKENETMRGYIHEEERRDGND